MGMQAMTSTAVEVKERMSRIGERGDDSRAPAT
jgi:hypothetical protein